MNEVARGGSPPTDDLVQRLKARDRAAIARTISSAESGGEPAAAVSRALAAHLGNARVIGVTGSPGVGKSTLVGALIAELRARNRTVGVVAVDPSSPISGGAILGDRVRMTLHGDDDGVFIRSLASRGRSGGLPLSAARIVDVLDVAGFDHVIIETVGAGQSEIDVAAVADVTVVVCAPGLGDDVQAMKAGLLEIADVLVVNKADDPMASITANQLSSMIALRQGRRQKVPVLKTAASRREGIAELCDLLDERLLEADNEARTGRRRMLIKQLIAATAAETLTGKLKHSRAAWLDRLCDQVARGELGLESAARSILERGIWRDD